MHHLPVAFLFIPVCLLGCGYHERAASVYVPTKPTPEAQELIDEYSKYRDAMVAAIARGGDYEQVAIVDRDTSLPDDNESYTRVLVLQREVLDLDDYGFSRPGRERSEEDVDHIGGLCGDVMFWVDDNGKLIVDEVGEPPGMYLVVEWYVPNCVGDRVSLHFGGNPCLEIDLAREGAG